MWAYPLARLEALESDNAGVEVVDLNDDEYGSTDEEDPGQFLSHLSSYQCQKDNVDTVCRDSMRIYYWTNQSLQMANTQTQDGYVWYFFLLLVVSILQNKQHSSSFFPCKGIYK